MAKNKDNAKNAKNSKKKNCPTNEQACPTGNNEKNKENQKNN